MFSTTIPRRYTELPTYACSHHYTLRDSWNEPCHCGADALTGNFYYTGSVHTTWHKPTNHKTVLTPRDTNQPIRMLYRRHTSWISWKSIMDRARFNYFIFNQKTKNLNNLAPPLNILRASLHVTAVNSHQNSCAICCFYIVSHRFDMLSHLTGKLVVWLRNIRTTFTQRRHTSHRYSAQHRHTALTCYYPDMEYFRPSTNRLLAS